MEKKSSFLENMGIKGLFGNFFQEKKVLITGHTGFKGSWLSIWLNELGAKVIGYALPPYTEKDNFVLTNLDKKIESIIGDVRDFDKVNEIFIKFKPEIVFHLAAQPIVRRSYAIPKETFDVNVGGTVNVFEAFRKSESARVLVNITTDKCYENQELTRGYKEDDRIGGHDPYSSSKACSELVTAAYRQSFFSKNLHQDKKVVSSARSGNVIGGGDWQEDRLVPDCIKALKEKKDILIRNPSAIRPWQYVLEPNAGYLLLAAKMWDLEEKYSGAWNFGPGKNSLFTVEDIVKKIIQYWGEGQLKTFSSQTSEELHETKTLILDCNKSYYNIGWKSAINIDETVKFLCEWYKEERVNYDFDVKQIKNYINLAKINKLEWAIS